MKRAIFLGIAMMLTIIAVGCSSSLSNPVTTQDSISDPFEGLSPSTESDSIRTLLGSFTVEVDKNRMEAIVSTYRGVGAHFNVAPLLPQPNISIYGFDPLTNIYDLGIKITNPYPIDAYDVRLIMFTGEDNIRMMNPDDWTSLYDIPGGWVINPFIAYAKLEPNRKFPRQAGYTERVQVSLPGDTTGNFVIAIDACFPSNCEEPYQIRDFKQTHLYFEQGSSAKVSVKVFDWQDNTNLVRLYCPAITGQSWVPFTYLNGNSWELNLVKQTGAHPGNYLGAIEAKSSNSGDLALYDIVTLTVDAEQLPYQPEVVAELDYNGELDVSGDHLYSGSGNLRVTNIENPENPYPEGIVSIEPSNTVSSLLYESMHCFMTAGYFEATARDGAFKIADVSNPVNPQIVGSIEMRRPLDLTISGNYAYVVDDMGTDDHLKIIDISDYNNPLQVAEYEPRNDFDTIDSEGSFIYSTQYLHFVVYNISNPILPSRVSDLPIQNHIYELKVKDSFAYCLFESNLYEYAMMVIDVRNPANPVVTDTLSFGDYLSGIDIQGDFAYTFESDIGLRVIDVSDPHDLYVFSEMPLFLSYLKDLKVQDRYAYLSSELGLTVIKLW